MLSTNIFHDNMIFWPVSMATMNFKGAITKCAITKEIYDMDVSYFSQR